MPIEPLCKVSIIAKKDEKENLLSSLQSFGFLHLVDMSQSVSNTHSLQVPESSEGGVSSYNKAIAYLNTVKHKRKPESLNTLVNVPALIGDVLANQLELHKLRDARDELFSKRDVMSDWGDIELPSEDDIGGNRLWFYLLPTKHKELLLSIDRPCQVVYKNHQKLWLVVVSPIEPPPNFLPVRISDVGPETLTQIREKIDQIDIQIEELESQRQRFTRYIKHMVQGRDSIIEKAELLMAKGFGIERDHLFLQMAWLPVKRVEEFKLLSDRLGFAAFFEEPNENDAPPTLLSNAGPVGGGELLVSFYQVPAYRSWDPSLMLFLSFSLFFAMILSDAGYALLLSACLILFSGKMTTTRAGRRLLPLLVCIFASSFVWGVLVGSYFGFGPPNRLLEQLKVFDVNDFDMMMTLSIGSGILHIVIANLCQVKALWGSNKAYQHIGWCFVLIGASIYALYDASLMIHSVGLWVLCLGLLGVFVNASDRPIVGLKSFVLRLLEGLKALTGVANLFGDVLSYLRLFALGLASASLALTFNQLADNAFRSDSGLGILLGILIMLVGHTLNLALGIVSGVVHGLRLNYIEFYKWALEGEGYPFKAFEKIGVQK